MTAVEVLDEVEEELAAAVEWYEDKNPGLGLDLFNTFEETIAALGRHAARPRRVPHVDESLPVRLVYLNRFPYAVIYLLGNDRLTVLAFAHHKRRPGYWLERIRK